MPGGLLVSESRELESEERFRLHRFLTVKRNPSRPAYILGSALALGHAVFYFTIMSTQFEGSWGGFLIFLVDLPASLLVLLLSNAFGIRTAYALLTGGTVWWFCIGILVAKLFTFFSKRVSS